jgi:hypothetical protein
VTGALATAAFLAGAAAQGPPTPDFARFYGIARQDGANLDPAEQPVVAFVGSASCGEGVTMVAEDGPGTPPGDVGKTVYVVDVAAAGSGPGQLPGCGTEGAEVRFYLPLAGRLGTATGAFSAGAQRADVDFDVELGEHRRVPMIAADVTP